MKTVVACDVFLGQDHLMRSGSMSRRNAIMTLGWGSLWVVQIERVNVCIVSHWALVSTKYNSANDIWCKEYIRLLARIAQMTRYIICKRECTCPGRPDSYMWYICLCILLYLFCGYSLPQVQLCAFYSLTYERASAFDGLRQTIFFALRGNIGTPWVEWIS